MMSKLITLAAQVMLLVAGIVVILLDGQGGSGTSTSILEMSLQRKMPAASAELSELSRCRLPRQSTSEAWAAAVAIVATESVARHPIEVLYEGALIWLGLHIGLPPPDLSLGPGQITPGHYLKASGSLDGYWKTVNSRCETLLWSMRWVDSVASERLNEPEQRRVVFGKWSGHDPSSMKEFETRAYFLFCERLFWRARRARDFAGIRYS